MNKPTVIGITGGIGGGKSTFSERLRACGQLVFDTDIEAKRLQDTDEKIQQELKKLFGDDIYQHQILNRKKIASIVFNDKNLLLQLNQLIHPRVKETFQQWVETNNQHKYLFMECAILFEGGFDTYVDKILVVTAPEKVRIERVMKRDNQTEEQVRARMKNQMNEHEKINQATWVIETNGVKNTEEKVDDFLKMISA